MGSKLDALLKVSLIAGVLFASGSVGYYFLVYLPQRDAQLDVERVQAKAQAEAAKQAQQERQADEAAEAQSRYRVCLDSAAETHNATWATSCKRVAEQSVTDHANCIAEGILTKQCNSTYPSRDSSPSCALPNAIAKDLNARLEKARDRCLQENKAGL